MARVEEVPHRRVHVAVELRRRVLVPVVVAAAAAVFARIRKDDRRRHLADVQREHVVEDEQRAEPPGPFLKGLLRESLHFLSFVSFKRSATWLFERLGDKVMIDSRERG